MKNIILLAIAGFGLNVFAAPAIGNVDAATMQADGSVIVAGWTCIPNVNQSIGVNVVSFGPKGFSLLVLNAPANIPNESAVDSVCGTVGINHRFAVSIDANTVRNLEGNTFRVYPAGQGIDYEPIAGDKLNPYGQIAGNIDSVTQDFSSGGLIVRGWACQIGKNIETSVLLSAGPITQVDKQPLALAESNVSSEKAINDVCQNGRNNNRFSARVPGSYLTLKTGEKLDVQAVLPDNAGYQQLPNSDKFILTDFTH